MDYGAGDGDTDGYLQFNCRITILGVGTNGYLCSRNTGTSSSNVEMEAAVDGEFPHSFERCVWSMLPVNIWSTGTSQLSSKLDSIRYPQHAMQRQPSLAQFSPRSGKEAAQYVRYGDLVLLQHVPTSSHLHVCPNLPSEVAPNCCMVEFVKKEHTNVADRCFRILPKYKIRQEGEAIRLKDQVSAVHTPLYNVTPLWEPPRKTLGKTLGYFSGTTGQQHKLNRCHSCASE